MTQNDFLAPWLSLNPIHFAVIVSVLCFGTILPVALKTGTVRSQLLKNPAFKFGDYLLLPLAAGLICYFYQNIQNPLPETTSNTWNLIVLFISGIITIGFGVKFRLLSIWWWLHGIFFWLFTYLFLNFITKGGWQILYGNMNHLLLADYFLGVLFVFIHQLMGIFYSKTLPLKH